MHHFHVIFIFIHDLIAKRSDPARVVTPLWPLVVRTASQLPWHGVWQSKFMTIPLGQSSAVEQAREAGSDGKNSCLVAVFRNCVNNQSVRRKAERTYTCIQSIAGSSKSSRSRFSQIRYNVPLARHIVGHFNVNV